MDACIDGKAKGDVWDYRGRETGTAKTEREGEEPRIGRAVPRGKERRRRSMYRGWRGRMAEKEDKSTGGCSRLRRKS
jgi:hypothetical protein